MLFLKLYRFLMGYVKIRVYGNFPERILNLMAKNGVNPWDIKKLNDEITLKILNSDFKKLRKIRAKCKVKIKILSKHGLYTKLKRFKLRYGLVAGLLVFVCLQIFLSLFVWQIEIVGNNNVSDSEIIDVCNSLNVRRGVLKSRLDLPVIKEELMLKLPNVAWAAINIEGCRATVNISEIKNEEADKTPANLISNYDCVIKSVKVLNGIAAVKPGQAVQKGDMLINGVVDTGPTVRYVKATGSVIGEADEIFTFSQRYTAEETYYNGNSKNRYVLEFFTLRIPLYLGNVSGNYDTERSNAFLRFFGEQLPIGYYCKNYKNFDVKTVTYTDAQIVKMLEDRFNFTMQQMGAQNVTVISQDICRNETEVIMTYHVKFDKNVGILENLLFK